MPHACHRFWKCYKTLTLCSLLTRSTIPLRLPRESTPERPKVARTCGALRILTSKRASRHNGVHFFDIATSKSGPRMVCSCILTSKCASRQCVLYILTSKCASRHNAVHFFDISTSKSGPNLVCFCTFWLRNVLRATTGCNSLSLIWPDGSAPAALASLLFDPPEPQIIGKNTAVLRDFPTFSRICVFFLLTLPSSLIFSLLPFPSAWLFPSLLFICPYCRKFDF